MNRQLIDECLYHYYRMLTIEDVRSRKFHAVMAQMKYIWHRLNLDERYEVLEQLRSTLSTSSSVQTVTAIMDEDEYFTEEGTRRAFAE